MIERAVVLGRAPRITLEDLPPRLTSAEVATVNGSVSYTAAVKAYRRELIMAALLRTGGNRAAAATALGLHRTHLMRLLKALRIE